MENDQFADLARQMGRAVDKFEGLERELGQLKGLINASPADTARAFLTGRYGKTGASHCAADVGAALKGLIGLRLTGRVPAEYRAALEKWEPSGAITEKAAATFTTSSSAPGGGYTVPTLVANEIDTLQQLISPLLSLVRRVTVAPFQSFQVPVHNALVTGAGWQKTDGSALTELELTITAGTLKPIALGTYCRASESLLRSSVVDFGNWVLGVIANDAAAKKEFAILQGEDAGDDNHDGVLVASGVNDQANVAASTEAAWLTFVDDSGADYGMLNDTNRAAIFTTWPKWRALIRSVVGSATVVTEPAARRFAGYRVIPTDNMLVSTTHYAAMFDPADVWTAGNGQMEVLIDPYSLMEQLTVRIRMVEWWDFLVASTDKFSKADFD